MTDFIARSKRLGMVAGALLLALLAGCQQKDAPSANTAQAVRMPDAATLAQLLEAHPALPHYAQPDGSAKLAAGWLIERCGWKGRDLGPVGSYEHQALVLVNRGGANGADVRCLAASICADVAAKFGVELEPEPIFVSGR